MAGKKIQKNQIKAEESVVDSHEVVLGHFWRRFERVRQQPGKIDDVKGEEEGEVEDAPMHLVEHEPEHAVARLAISCNFLFHPIIVHNFVYALRASYLLPRVQQLEKVANCPRANRLYAIEAGTLAQWVLQPNPSAQKRPLTASARRFVWIRAIGVVRCDLAHGRVHELAVTKVRERVFQGR